VLLEIVGLAGAVRVPDRLGDADRALVGREEQRVREVGRERLREHTGGVDRLDRHVVEVGDAGLVRVDEDDPVGAGRDRPRHCSRRDGLAIAERLVLSGVPHVGNHRRHTLGAGLADGVL